MVIPPATQVFCPLTACGDHGAIFVAAGASPRLGGLLDGDWI